MPQQVEFEGFDLQFRDQLQGFHCRGYRAERLLVAMAVQQRLFPRHRRERQFEAAGATLGGDEFLEELGALGERGGFGAREYRREFVAQRQEASRFQPDDRRAGGNRRGERIQHAARFGLAPPRPARRRERSGRSTAAGATPGSGVVTR